MAFQIERTRQGEWLRILVIGTNAPGRTQQNFRNCMWVDLNLQRIRRKHHSANHFVDQFGHVDSCLWPCLGEPLRAQKQRLQLRIWKASQFGELDQLIRRAEERAQASQNWPLDLLSGDPAGGLSRSMPL